MVKKALLALLMLIVFLAFLQQYAFAASPSVTLVSPGDGNVSSASNMTFVCNASDDGNVYNVSLFTDINGSFAVYNTKKIMETESDASTTLLCRFDGTYTCDGGESGTASETDFATTKFMQGVRINETDTLTYPTAGNLNYDKGSLEFWIMPDTSGDNLYLFSTDSYGGIGNRIKLYTESGSLKFEFIDNANPENILSAEYPIAWGSEWHHVVLLWDLYNNAGTCETDLFVDGSNSSTSCIGSYTEHGSSFGTNMYLGSNKAGGSQQTGVYDEFIAFNRVLSADEIYSSYIKGAADHYNESVNWTISNISDGAHKWACLASRQRNGKRMVFQPHLLRRRRQSAGSKQHNAFAIARMT